MNMAEQVSEKWAVKSFGHLAEPYGRFSFSPDFFMTEPDSNPPSPSE